MKGHMEDGKFHPHTEHKKGVRKSRDQEAKTEGVIIRKSRAIDEETNLDMKVKKLEESLKQGLDEHFKNNPKFKNAVWEVGIMYTGSHGTVDSEYFTITAFRKGVGSVEYQEAFSNDDWFDTSDSKLVKKIENDQEFAQKEYDKWLISILDIYEDAMFEGLTATIESEYA